MFESEVYLWDQIMFWCCFAKYFDPSVHSSDISSTSTTL